MINFIVSMIGGAIGGFLCVFCIFRYIAWAERREDDA